MCSHSWEPLSQRVVLTLECASEHLEGLSDQTPRPRPLTAGGGDKAGTLLTSPSPCPPVMLMLLVCGPHWEPLSSRSEVRAVVIRHDCASNTWGSYPSDSSVKISRGPWACDFLKISGVHNWKPLGYWFLNNLKSKLYKHYLRDLKFYMPYIYSLTATVFENAL